MKKYFKKVTFLTKNNWDAYLNFAIALSVFLFSGIFQMCKSFKLKKKIIFSGCYWQVSSLLQYFIGCLDFGRYFFIFLTSRFQW